jgi:hypothetical protein
MHRVRSGKVVAQLEALARLSSRMTMMMPNNEAAVCRVAAKEELSHETDESILDPRWQRKSIKKPRPPT